MMSVFTQEEANKEWQVGRVAASTRDCSDRDKWRAQVSEGGAR